MEDTPQWGVEPVPARLQLLGFFDSFLLWANLSVSLLVKPLSAAIISLLAACAIGLPRLSILTPWLAIAAAFRTLLLNGK